MLFGKKRRQRSRSLDLRQQRLQDIIDYYGLTYERLAMYIGTRPEIIAKSPRMVYRPLQKQLSLTNQYLLGDTWDVACWPIKMRVVRTRFGWSRYDFAAYLNVSYNRVACWESFRQVDIPYIVRLAVASLDKIGSKGLNPPKHKELFYDSEKSEQERAGKGFITPRY